MANKKISELASATTPLSGAELIEIVQSGTNKQVAASALIGAAGPEGDPGAPGADGLDGSDGADGRTVLSGPGAPSSGLGADGDFYIDTTDWDIYGPKTAGAWGSGTSLVGSPGSTDAVPEGSVNLYHTTGRAAAAAPVQSVIGLTGTILAAALKSALALVKGDVGLGNVDNTSDANKPVSTATQTALDAKRSITTSRERLTGNRNYYVRTDGSDSNDGLANTSGGAFLTIQKAIDTAAALDLSIYNVIIDVADGTYTGGLTLKSYVGGGYILIRGNTTTPANVLLNVTGNCVYGEDCGNWQLSGVKLVSTSRGIYLVGRSALKISLIDFGACTYNHMLIESGARVRATGNWTISGGSGSAHIGLNYGGSFVAAVLTCTITGTPALTYFVDASIGSNATLQAMTFSGSATGTRYSATMNSVIQTYGGGSTYLPGNVAGSTATGGQYA